VTGCVHAPNSRVCEDGDACTEVDACAGGSCQPGDALDCDDEDPCTDDSCDFRLGCFNEENTGPCEDGDACTTGDRCQHGDCDGDVPLDCNDERACTSDTCDSASGCVNAPIEGHCDDGEDCTGDTLTVSDCSCENARITARVHGDGCCPAGANAVQDSDCDPVCGNRVAEPGEHCDTAISSGTEGSCPSTCDDADPCTLDNHEGTLCEQRCEHPPTPPTDGDLCCPEGSNPGVDNDCPAMTTTGFERGVFTVKYAGWIAPVLVPAPNRFFAAASAAQGGGGPVEVAVLDNTGRVLKKHSPNWAGGGGCFETMNPAYNDGRFQMLYQYKCRTGHNGSYAPDNQGGWGCIELLEYDLEGNLVSGPLRWGRDGHNGHPNLDWNGTRFGVGWVSYDDVYFRQIDAARALVGDDPMNDNLLLGNGPTDDRNYARTRVVYNPDSDQFGVFSILGSRTYGAGKLYMSRVSGDGAKLSGISNRGKAMSECGSGYFEADYSDDRYYVVYNDYEKVVLQMLSGTGVSEGTVTLSMDNYPWPNMARINNQFSVLTQDADGRTSVTTFDLTGQIVRERTGRLDHGEDELNMPYLAYEPTSASMALIYLNDDTQIVFRSVAFVD
jgi:hypothetical protein